MPNFAAIITFALVSMKNSKGLIHFGLLHGQVLKSGELEVHLIPHVLDGQQICSIAKPIPPVY